MIYKPLIEIGELGTLRVSKLVNQNAVPLLSKHAVLRAKVGRRYYTTANLDLTASILYPRYSTLAFPDTIQHVNLRIDMVDFGGPDIDLRLIKHFGGNEFTWESCDITINVNSNAKIASGLENFKIYRAIAALTGFKVLLLKFEYERDQKASDAIQERYRLAMVQMGKDCTYQQILDSYGKVQAFLKTKLGPAHCQKHIDRHFLKFWPSQHKSAACPVEAAKAPGGGEV